MKHYLQIALICSAVTVQADAIAPSELRAAFNRGVQHFTQGYTNAWDYELARAMRGSEGLIGRASHFFRDRGPEQNVSEQTDLFQVVGQACGHAAGFVGSWLSAVDVPENEQFRQVVLRVAAVTLVAYILRKLCKRSDSR